MYGRAPNATSWSATGVRGSIMGPTLGYLALLLLILSVATVVSLFLGTVGMWVGLVMMFGGTILVNRSARKAHGALLWAAVTAVGMGLLVGPLVWSVAASDQSLMLSTLGTVVIAVGFSAALVSWIPWDFSRLAPLLMVGVLLLVVTGLISMVVPAASGIQMSTTFNMIGVLIFTGYLLVDFSLMRYRRLALPDQGAALVLATYIMIDIVNLFLFLLRLGRR
jgi:FtsH-binding integral membrane protein